MRQHEQGLTQTSHQENLHYPHYIILKSVLENYFYVRIRGFLVLFLQDSPFVRT